MTDIGEDLVGDYLRLVQGCDLVAFNTRTGKAPAEIDVIGVRSRWLPGRSGRQVDRKAGFGQGLRRPGLPRRDLMIHTAMARDWHADRIRLHP